MPKFFVRSTLFNLCFYCLTGVACIALLPTLILPRRFYMAVVYGFVHCTAFLEKSILGLTYEIRGQEHLPEEGAYIVAAKHQSAYETFKLHILFKDPAIVLKKELLKIPLWGQYLKKSDVIAIDRSTPKAAIKSIQDGAKHVAMQKRPIIIFPQGTRVSTNISAQEKPYKIGVMRVQEATNLPIIPLALNTGVFYPKHAWCKKPGRVIFEFLPAIPPNPEQDAGHTLKELEMHVEETSSRLMDEGRKNIPFEKIKKTKIIFSLFALLFIGYNLNWLMFAKIAQHQTNKFLEDIKSKAPRNGNIHLSAPKISGFPFKVKITMGQHIMQTQRDVLVIDGIEAQSWPFMGMPIDIKTGSIRTKSAQNTKPLKIDSLTTRATWHKPLLKLTPLTLKLEDAILSLDGHIDFSASPHPTSDFSVHFTNHKAVITYLKRNGLINSRAESVVSSILGSIERDNVIQTTLTNDQKNVYLGPIAIMAMPPKGFIKR